MRRAFTLIELLVVVSIISVLSSIVLASLNTARERSRDTSVKTQVMEFRKLMALEYQETGSYANLNQGWAGTGGGTCEGNGYAGTFTNEAISMCNRIRDFISNKNSLEFYTGVNTGAGLSNSSQFSIIARLSNGRYFCLGSSGGMSENNINDGAWLGAGCYGNP